MRKLKQLKHEYTLIINKLFIIIICNINILYANKHDNNNETCNISSTGCKRNRDATPSEILDAWLEFNGL